MSAAAVIVAAGSGQRFGNAGKSFAMAAGMPMAWWSLRAADAADTISEIVLVCGEHSYAAAHALLSASEFDTPISLQLGGARRQDSARAGLSAITPGTDIVAIHDAARPLVTADLFDQSVEAAAQHGAAVVAVQVTDTIKRVSNDIVVETVPRDDLVAVQTPQAFRIALLTQAFEDAERTGTMVTDEAALIESIGLPVRVVAGRADNVKVTYPADLALVDALLGYQIR